MKAKEEGAKVGAQEVQGQAGGLHAGSQAGKQGASKQKGKCAPGPGKEREEKAVNQEEGRVREGGTPDC